MCLGHGLSDLVRMQESQGRESPYSSKNVCCALPTKGSLGIFFSAGNN